MIILSIDSGVERTGWAIFDKDKKYKDGLSYIASGLIKTLASRDHAARLADIHEQVVQIIKKYKPVHMVIEQLFFFKNQKTVISVAQAQGVVLTCAALHEIKTSSLTPLEIKQIVTGYGQADKKGVQKMLKLTLGLDDELKQDDQADAIACGLAYCFLNNQLQ